MNLTPLFFAITNVFFFNRKSFLNVYYLLFFGVGEYFPHRQMDTVRVEHGKLRGGTKELKKNLQMKIQFKMF